MSAWGTNPHLVTARENPFRIERTDSLRFRFASGHWSSHLARLQALRYRAAIVGPQGSGKSTLLAELSGYLRDRGLTPIECRAPINPRANLEWLEQLTRSLSDEHVILVDSAEKLPKILWWRLQATTKSRFGLVVTVHHRCALPTWILCESSWDILRSLLADLNFESDTDSVIEAARHYYRSHCGNIRDVFRGLYDEVANGNLRVNCAADSRS